MSYDIIHGKLTTIDREITARCIDILNHADPDLYQFMQYSVNAHKVESRAPLLQRWYIHLN